MGIINDSEVQVDVAGAINSQAEKIFSVSRYTQTAVPVSARRHNMDSILHRNVMGWVCVNCGTVSMETVLKYSKLNIKKQVGIWAWIGRVVISVSMVLCLVMFYEIDTWLETVLISRIIIQIAASRLVVVGNLRST